MVLRFDTRCRRGGSGVNWNEAILAQFWPRSVVRPRKKPASGPRRAWSLTKSWRASI